MRSVLLFPGSFDPFTIGHKDIVDRALASFADEVIIAIGVHPQKKCMFIADERIAQIKRIFASEPRVKVCSYDGLTTDLAQKMGVTALLRSVRSVKDYEYECELADINRQLTGIETIILIAQPQYAAISSSTVRELIHYGKDVSTFLP